MTQKLMITVADELYHAIKAKVGETGTPYSFIARRALENWVTNGVVPARVPGLTSGENGHIEPAQEEPVTPEARPSRPA